MRALSLLWFSERFRSPKRIEKIRFPMALLTHCSFSTKFVKKRLFVREGLAPGQKTSAYTSHKISAVFEVIFSGMVDIKIGRWQRTATFPVFGLVKL
jgi:hypothetical protein